MVEERVGVFPHLGALALVGPPLILLHGRSPTENEDWARQERKSVAAPERQSVGQIQRETQCSSLVLQRVNPYKPFGWRTDA